MKTNKEQEKDLLNKIQNDNNVKKKALKKIIKALDKKNNNNLN